MNRLSKFFSKGSKTTSDDVVVEKKPSRQRSGLKTSSLKETEQRFYQYLVGKSAPHPQAQDAASELPEDRILLDIELGPALKRQAEKQANADLLNDLQAQLFQRVEERVEAAIEQLDPKLLGEFTISKNLIGALELLSTRAASISRLKPLLATETAVLRDMINLLNRFNLCQKPGDNPLELKDAHLGMGFLGVDRLRFLLPYLVLNDSLRKSGQSFDQSSRKLWTHLQCTADTARLLAKEDEKLSPEIAYTLSMLHEIGSIYLFHLTDRCFKEELVQMRREARDDLAGDVDQLLASVRSAAPVLNKLLPLRTRTLGARLAKNYELKYLTLAGPMGELAEAMTFDELGPYARLIAQGRSYSQFRLLYKNKLINKEQAAELLSYYQLDNKTLAVLNKHKWLKVPAIEN